MDDNARLRRPDCVESYRSAAAPSAKLPEVMRHLPILIALLAVLPVGCERPAPVGNVAVQSARPKPTPQPAKRSRPAAKRGPPLDSPATQQKLPVARSEPQESPAEPPTDEQPDDFDLPAIDDARLTAAGIRRVAGRHITLYTDVPAGEVDELPAVFDAALPLWCEYFGVSPAKTAQWKVAGHVMRDKERFVGAGLFLDSLPPFPNGFSQGSQLWLYDQPSAYYRRHLLLHEGTHCFMYRWLGGAGPPWYMEGLAELLGTHRWEAGKLTLAVMPRTSEEVPYWGRIKIVRDEYAAGRGMSLDQIMGYDSRAHLRNEPYGWCWAAAAFFDAHPQAQTAFRELKSDVRNRGDGFSRRFVLQLKADWRHINEDWQLFVAQCDYGYDFARAAVARKPTTPLPAGGAKITLKTDRGWQSSGYTLEAGKAYLLSSSGRFTVAAGDKPWPCEAGGVTLRYHRGRPLGMLLASVESGQGSPFGTQLVHPQAVGLSAEIKSAAAGTLFLCINEAASGLADNQGTLEVEIRPQ
jgi:hypothetical protein